MEYGKKGSGERPAFVYRHRQRKQRVVRLRAAWPYVGEIGTESRRWTVKDFMLPSVPIRVLFVLHGRSEG